MVTVNHNYLKLPGSYLFSTIAKKVKAYKEANPKTEAVTLKQTKSLYLTVQRAIPEISRKYSDWITRLQCATLYTQYM